MSGIPETLPIIGASYQLPPAVCAIIIIAIIAGLDYIGDRKKRKKNKKE